MIIIRRVTIMDNEFFLEFKIWTFDTFYHYF